jgi:hypothetical protein
MIRTIILALTILPLTVFAQQFPNIQTENLNGKKVMLPSDLPEKSTVLGIAFSQKAQEDMATWIEPVYRQFIDKSGLGAMIYDVNSRMLVAFTGAKRAASRKAEKMIKKATENDFYPYVLLHKGSFRDFKDAIDIKNKDEFYILILDPNGKVIFKTTGRYTENKFDKISLIIEE